MLGLESIAPSADDGACARPRTPPPSRRRLNGEGEAIARPFVAFDGAFEKLAVARNSAAPPRDPPAVAPLRGLPADAYPWEGAASRKPWDHLVTAAIPVLDTWDTLELVVELLRLQSSPPFIVLVDTGSQPSAWRRIEALRAADVEVHSLRLNGVLHPSDFPAMAMDLAFSVCRTEFLFATHADCFLRKRTFLEELLSLCPSKSSVVGYEITPRRHEDWRGMASHTATMYHMPTMDRIGFGWSLRRLCAKFGIRDPRPDPLKPNWPDTELLGNYILREHRIEPWLIGKEENHRRTLDENIDHCRTLTAGLLYSPEYYRQAQAWAEDAKRSARGRIVAWRAARSATLGPPEPQS